MTTGNTTSPTKLTASSIEPDTEKLNLYPWFDWLRFCLASIVVLGHADFQFLPILDGGLAVAVFFALSGWLIGGILLNTKKEQLPRFFFNRATRIWIPYALAIALLYGLAAVHEGIDFFWFKYLILDVTFTHQLYTFFPAASYEMPLDGSGNQFWSIAVEEQFYLLAPLVIVFTPFGKSIKLWALIAVALTLLNSAFAAISLGVCAAILQRDFGFANRSVVRYFAIAIAIVCGIGISTFNTNFIFEPLLAVSVVIATAIPGARSSFAMTMGGLSYPLYLNHWAGVFAVNFVSKRWLPIDEATFIIVQYILNVIIALGLYWIVDKQIQKRRNSWFTPQIGRTLTKTAYGLVALGIIAGGAMHSFGPHGESPSVVSKMDNQSK
jgi:peptidoglycan/LPS O-acetylase OafA/YrhL